MIFYFSGCGNSRFIAESIAQALNEQLVFIPEAERKTRLEYSLAEGERVGFVFPIYSWCPPQLVLEFVQKLKFSQTPDYVWMAVTCGDNGGVAEKVFAEKLAEMINKRIVYQWPYDATYHCEVRLSSLGHLAVAYGAAGMFIDRFFALPSLASPLGTGPSILESLSDINSTGHLGKLV